MPITVTAPRGVLTPAGEREILPRLTEALIEVSGLTGNAFFTSVVGGTVHILEPHDVYAGGAPLSRLFSALLPQRSSAPICPLSPRRRG